MIEIEASDLRTESPPLSRWSIDQAAALYGIHAWGEGFFTISESGEVMADLMDIETRERARIGIKKLVQELEQRGLNAPMLLRFPFILESRIELLHQSFASAIGVLEYKGSYRGVFPIKVNQQQQVIEEISAFGRRFHYGLEAGSKPELIAALSYLDDPQALIVCNGYKDQEFIDLALLGRKMGLDVVLVIEMPHELTFIEERAAALGVEPAVGIRVKLSTEAGGHWSESSGEQSPFGLNIAQLIQMVDRLRSGGRLDWLRMLHCHQGSQVPDLSAIREAAEEAARIYVGLVAEGAPMGLINLGGGLAVDYDGSRSIQSGSSNYSVQEYCHALVESVMSVCDEAGIAHPSIVTESGRAIAAHYSMLVIKILDVNRFECQSDDIALPDDAADPILGLARVAGAVNSANLLESYDKAFRYREELRDLFMSGRLSLRDRSIVEQLFWRILTKVAHFSKDLHFVPEKLQALDGLLADHYYGNFSVFQSLADAWAINQVFPVVPLHRLNERPNRSAVVNDVTCDCDGKLKRYVSLFDERATLPLHNVTPDEDYFLGIFLVGAYQETLSDLHNLFGDTHAVSVEIRNGRPHLSREVEGDTVADVLAYVEHDPKRLVDNFRRLAENAVNEGRITAVERKRALDAFKMGMDSYTYFES